MNLKSIPDDVLNRAIKEAPDGRPVRFIHKGTGRIVQTEKALILAEQEVRRLDKEVFQASEFFKYTNYGAYTSPSPGDFYSMGFPNSLRHNSNSEIRDTAIKDVIDHLDSLDKPPTNLLYKVIDFFSKFSIKFAKVKDDAIGSTKGTGEVKVPEVVLDMGKGPSGTSETLSNVETEGK